MKNIDIAFCFDANQWMQAGVAIVSLLRSSVGKCHYNIYCGVSDDVDVGCRLDLSQIVAKYDSDSVISFLTVGHSFDNAYISGHISTAAYFRLMLHRLLPALDKVIYSDVDVIFRDSLLELDSVVLGNNLLAGVYVDGEEVNSGVLVMNLCLIRQENMEEKWAELLKQKLVLHDQSILNSSCRGRFTYINPKFNMILGAYGVDLRKTSYTEEQKRQLVEAWKNPVVVHYTTSRKPWLCDKMPVRYFNLWWFYAGITPFFNVLLFYYTNNNRLSHKLAKVFVRICCGFIPFRRVRYRIRKRYF